MTISRRTEAAQPSAAPTLDDAVERLRVAADLFSEVGQAEKSGEVAANFHAVLVEDIRVVIAAALRAAAPSSGEPLLRPYGWIAEWETFAGEWEVCPTSFDPVSTAAVWSWIEREAAKGAVPRNRFRVSRMFVGNALAAAPSSVQGAAEPRELLCMKCGKEHPVWFADSPVWNAVVRRADGSDAWSFLCPTCFTVLAAEHGFDGRWHVRHDAGAAEPVLCGLCKKPPHVPFNRTFGSHKVGFELYPNGWLSETDYNLRGLRGYTGRMGLRATCRSSRAGAGRCAARNSRVRRSDA